MVMKIIMFSLFLLFGCFISNVNAQNNYSFTFSYNSSETEGNVASITKITLTDTADVVIPETVEYEGFTFYVRNIGKTSYVVTNRNYVRSLSFPSGLKTIGNNAFAGCNNLINVIFNDGLESIGQYAFADCPKLTFIEIPSSVSYIGGGAFTRVPTGTNYSGTSYLKTAIIHCAANFDINEYVYGHPFYPNSNLTTIIYTNSKAPQNWVATTRTYVPQKSSYTSPKYNLTTIPHIVEMITFNENTFEYTGNQPNVTWINNVEGYTATMDNSVLKVDVGTYTDNIPFKFNNGEHSFEVKIPFKYTITPIKLTASVSNYSREYGNSNPQFAISYAGFINGDNENVLTAQPNVTTTATTTSNVGEYPISISGGKSTNYAIDYEPGVLTVTKAPLSAKVCDTTKVYGLENPAFTIKYYGLKNSEIEPTWITSPTFQTNATQNSGVGEYEVKAENGVPINYDLNSITSGNLNITPAPLIIKARDAVRQYYDENPQLSYSCNGFVNGEDISVLAPAPTLSTSANVSSNVGTYEIKVADANSPNYSISYVNGTLNITPRTLIASVDNYERLYNEDNPEFVVRYDGFVGNDNESVLSSKASANTTATKTSNVGTYQITVSDGSADNYNFSYTSGTLTINKAEQVISWEQDLSELKVGDQVELKAVTTSGLPITYSISSNSAVDLYSAGNKSYLDCKSGGQLLIRAVQNGNNNYYSSQRVVNNVSIIGSYPTTDPTLTIKQIEYGSVSLQVSKGSVQTISIAAIDGWKIHSVTFNDEDVTSLLTSINTYTTPSITSNSTLSIVYEQIDDAVYQSSASNVRIQSTSYGIRVLDANLGDMINIYTTDGKLQQSVKVMSPSVDIPLASGEYIVKVGAKTVKLIY